MDDQRCGSGKFFYINGDVYDGEWKADKRHGHGTYTYADTGSRYVGSWRDGQRNGHGELIHANHKFVGKFTDDKVTRKAHNGDEAARRPRVLCLICVHSFGALATAVRVFKA